MSKKFYLIYKITNNLNQKFYIGKHETNNLDDNYFGSGKLLNRAKKKYGLENFTKTILFYCHNQEEMALLEKCVVTPEFCQREDVYNLNEGGDGGWSYVNTSGKSGSKKGGNIIRQRWNNLSKEEYELSVQINYSYFANWLANNPNYFAGENNPMFGHVYTQETLDKMSSSKQGEKNNRYGSKWYYDPVTFESHSFLPDEKIPEGWIRGRKIKKKNDFQVGCQSLV